MFQSGGEVKPDLWIDGEFIPWEKARIHPLCHSLQRGATVFESINCTETIEGKAAIFRLHDHMLRFENSSRLTGMPLGYYISDLEKAVVDTVRRSGLTRCIIRPLAIYSDPVFDLFPGNAHVSIVIAVGEKEPEKESLKVKMSRLQKIESSSMPVKAKVSGNYIAPMIAKSEAISAGFDDTILLDRDGNVAEGATSNIFIVENGVFVTPPGFKILQGITRDTIMALSQQLGIRFSEETINPERLQNSDEVFMCSSGRGIVPVVQIDSVIIGDGRLGETTEHLRQYYRDITRGLVPEFGHWLTII